MNNSKASVIYMTAVLFNTNVMIYCLMNGDVCRVTPDPVFNGSLVNCSNQKLALQDLSDLPFQGVSTLDISHNNIGHLPDGVFERFNQLKCLICSWCGLNWIGKHSLKGLDILEVLSLDHNTLKMDKWKNNQHTIPRGVFQYVPTLRKLYIDNNGYYTEIVTGYSDFSDIFEYLPQLTHLSIDSFRNLKIGSEFLNFTKLHSLYVNCHSTRRIDNSSLEGFRNSTVKYFELAGGDLELPWVNVGLYVFEHLPDVSHLVLRRIRVGNQNILSMMKPLAGRRMDTIVFDSVYTPALGNFSAKVSDTSITVKDSIHLMNINVSNFLWFDSAVYCVQYRALLSRSWCENIKTLVLETDALTRTSILLLFRMMHLKNVEVFAYLWTVSGLRHQFDGYLLHGLKLEEFDFRTGLTWTGSRKSENEALSATRRPFNHFPTVVDRNVSPISNINEPFLTFEGLNTTGHYGQEWIETRLQADGRFFDYLPLTSTKIIITPPPKLKMLILDGMHYLYLNPNHTYTVRENQIATVALTNAIGPVQLNGKLIGLENITTLNLQGSQQLDLGLECLDHFPGLTNLNLRQTSMTPDFYEANGKQIIEKLSNLEFLDMSENGIKRLPDGIFTTNRRLKHLVLAKNRLSFIPFKLELTPALEILDLRGNSLVDVDDVYRDAIDRHILSVRNFSILLDDNQFSCTCSKLSFIKWLHRQRQYLDQNGNYSCISDDGDSSTIDANVDMYAFWRKCRGNYYLLVSIISACAILAVYLVMLLGMKNRTQIISSVMTVIVPGFRLKTRRDFCYDVFIGYADIDVMYVKDVLLRCLEHEWRLHTFVHQRDLRHDPVEMSQALRDSWRCLLVVTESFLYRYDMAHNIMKVASFFVGPSNPRSVVVMVEESVRHRIPDYVLQVVDEDNILELPRLDSVLDYETKEFLRTRLSI